MIPLKRIRSEEAVAPVFRGKARIARNLDLIPMKQSGLLDGPAGEVWDQAVWKEAKAQLLKESSGKCAYCESPTSVVSFGDVEHFRPKSKYWWLAYCYENYLPACIICNQKFKRDHFALAPKGVLWTGPKLPKKMSAARMLALAREMTVDPLDDDAGMPMKQYLAAIKKEGALIVNPYLQSPAEFFAYKPVLKNKEMLVVPLRPAQKAVVDACNKYFGINRQELRDERFRHYALYMTYRHTLEVKTIPLKLRKAVTARLAEMSRGNLRYTGMIRYFDGLKLEDLPWDFGLELD